MCSFIFSLYLLDAELNRRQLRGLQADKCRTQRLKSWKNYIDKEAHYINLITLVLKTELALILEPLLPSDPRVIFARDEQYQLEGQFHRQSLYVYHQLYYGVRDRIRVVDSRDRSINGRYGLIIGYDKAKQSFLVHLDTKTVTPSTMFTGEKRYICGSNLQIVPIHYSLGSPHAYLDTVGHSVNSRSTNNNHFVPALPDKTSAMIISIDPVGTKYNTVIEVRRNVLDVLQQCLVDDPTISLDMSFVRPFIFCSKCEPMLRKQAFIPHRLDTKRNDLRENSPWHLEFDDDGNIVDRIQSRLKYQDIRMQLPPDTPTGTSSLLDESDDSGCHNNVPNGAQIPQGDSDACYVSPNNHVPGHQCNGCCHHDPSKPNSKLPSREPTGSLADHFTDKSNFDLNLVTKPHDILVHFPFRTTNSGLITAAIELNELNISPTLQRVRSEEEIFDVLSRLKVAITNRDLYSLFPYEFISDSIIDLWSQW